jgi:hypothetical protein
MQVLEVPEVVVGGLRLWYFVVWFWLASVDPRHRLAFEYTDNGEDVYSHIRELHGILNEEDWDVVACSHISFMF